MAIAVRIRVVDKVDGTIRIWTARHVPRAWNCTLGKKSHYVTGWALTDHGEVERFSEGNWIALIPYVHMIADNYGFVAKVS